MIDNTNGNRRTFLFAIAATLAAVASAVPAMAQSYSGNWPVTVSGERGDNGSVFEGMHCLTLTDNGSEEWPHSGPATSDYAFEPTFGEFQVIGRTIAVTFELVGSFGQNAGLVFTAGAKNGTITHWSIIKATKGLYFAVLSGIERHEARWAQV